MYQMDGRHTIRQKVKSKSKFRDGPSQIHTPPKQNVFRGSSPGPPCSQHDPGLPPSPGDLVLIGASQVVIGHEWIISFAALESITGPLPGKRQTSSKKKKRVDSSWKSSLLRQMICRPRLLALYYQVHMEADNKILGISKGGHGNNLDILFPFVKPRAVESQGG